MVTPIVPAEEEPYNSLLRQTPLDAPCKLKVGGSSNAFTVSEFKICELQMPVAGVMGVVGYDRITFLDEPELASKMLALVHQWKTTGSQALLFDASDSPRLRGYAVANCGVVASQTKVVVAVYRSAWDTYWANWANLLGK